MINQLMQALARFRSEATPDSFKQIFDRAGALTLWRRYHGNFGCDVVRFWDSLNERHRLLFEVHLSAQLPPPAFDSPRCVECGGELTEADIEIGEDVCLDCAAKVALGGDTYGPHASESDIDHEPGSLLATVRVRLAEIEHGERDE